MTRILVFIFTLLTCSATYGADVKISQLPLGVGATTGINDSFPYVSTATGVTKRLTLYDIANIPSIAAQFAALTGSPTFTGTVTAAGFIGPLTGNVTGNVTGNASTVTTNANLTGPITSVGNATSIASQTGTGTTFVMSVSPTLITPALGTPSALVGTNITGTAAGLTAGTVTTNANLTGDVTSVGNATTIGAAKVTNSMLFGSIAASKLIGSDIATVGTISAGTWQGSIVQPTYGGTGQSSVAAAFISFYESVATTLGDLIYGGASGTPTRLAGNTTTTPKFLKSVGSGSAATAPTWTQPVCSDLSNAAASCSTDATNATNISSGTLPAARLPNPSASTLGGVQSAAAVSNQWINSISTSGVPALSQPAFTNISGSVAASQMPALTGDVTTVAGAVATTIGAAKVTNSMLAGSIAASKLVGTDIATVGTITAGTWNGTAISSTYGGLGVNASASTGFPYDTAGTFAIKTATQATALLDAMVGDSGSGGTKGLVPAPATGDATKYLKGDGSWGAVSPSSLSQGTMTAFTASGTFTTPSNSSTSTIYRYQVQGGGGGGGAGGTSGNAGCSGGAGAGGYSEGTFTGVAASTGITITVGTGGAGGTGGGTGPAGSNGVASSIGSPLSVTANGGAGVVGYNAAAGSYGGAGGSASGGTVNVSGGYGSSCVTSKIGGLGGSSFFGGGGTGGLSGINGTGAAGGGYGAGGGGAVDQNGSGGSGKAGIVIIYQLTP